MWFVIAAVAVAAVVAVSLMVRRTRRRVTASFGELSREDQVQVMRNRQGGGSHTGAREVAKHHGSGQLGERFGGSGQ